MGENSKFPSDEAERFQVRMPSGLRDRLRVAAEANHRSMNSEIVARLEASFGDPDIDVSKLSPAQSRALAEVDASLRALRRLTAEDLAERASKRAQQSEGAS